LFGLEKSLDQRIEHVHHYASLAREDNANPNTGSHRAIKTVTKIGEGVVSGPEIQAIPTKIAQFRRTRRSPRKRPEEIRR
jgi:hypothetical protein